MGGGQIARCVGDDLHSDVARVHIGDSLRAKLHKLVKKPWDGFEVLIAGVGLGIGGAGEEVLFEGDYWFGTH
jgi:hypothetical protein